MVTFDMEFLKQFVMIPGCNSVHGRNPARPTKMYAEKKKHTGINMDKLPNT